MADVVNPGDSLRSQSLGRGLTRSRTSQRTLFSGAMTVLTFLATGIALLPLVAVIFYVVIHGASRLSLDLFTELPPPPLVKGGGFGNAILGTLMIVGIAAAISIPFGVLAAICLPGIRALLPGLIS